MRSIEDRYIEDHAEAREGQSFAHYPHAVDTQPFRNADACLRELKSILDWLSSYPDGDFKFGLSIDFNRERVYFADPNDAMLFAITFGGNIVDV
ncbi:hypothetical protein P6144_00195 [Sphingomonas sp. HITSZ_GF]|uniref:hypothetical protein n=1 Tax=Sphingomonas sp. HITSZ_GF TaxID=3037247 RepID=UPI00240D8AE6|nr:hypothetical protein [Sphingomonas sp. HITSZ_GF]MDG2532055.1 hypothetical protein [Sphingomonas sp. HITSZ_GF]